MEKNLEQIAEEIEVEDNRNILRKGYDWSKNHINYKLGAAGAGVGGGIAFYANFEHGLLPSSLAFAKQAVYVFIAGGYNSRTCEKLAKKFDSKTLSVASSAVGTTLQAGVLMYGLHSLTGTPNALETASYISLLNFPVFLGLGSYFRKHHDNGTKGLFQ